MTEPNRVWWIVLSPTAMRELLGVLVDDQGHKVALLMGPLEEPLVRDLAAHADPTVDVSVAFSWEQVPEVVRAGYEAEKAAQAEVRKRDGANANGTALGRIVRRQR